MGTIILVIGALLVGAFALRILIESSKLLYKIAPFVVIWAILLGLMYWAETGNNPVEDLKDNATVIGTTKN